MNVANAEVAKCTFVSTVYDKFRFGATKYLGSHCMNKKWQREISQRPTQIYVLYKCDN